MSRSFLRRTRKESLHQVRSPASRSLLVRGQEGRTASFHIRGTTPIEVPIFDLPRERRETPAISHCRHNIHMPAEQEVMVQMCTDKVVPSSAVPDYVCPDTQAVKKSLDIVNDLLGISGWIFALDLHKFPGKVHNVHVIYR